MVASDDFAEFLRDQLAPLGRITMRPMQSIHRRPRTAYSSTEERATKATTRTALIAAFEEAG